MKCKLRLGQQKPQAFANGFLFALIAKSMKWTNQISVL